MSKNEHPRFSSEEEMYSLWSATALPASRLWTRDGTPILVVSPGRRNRLPGPDFLDAVLVIAGEIRVGPVEMHRLEREWFEHRHDRDRAYDPVILHVIGEENRGRGPDVPTLVLDPNGTHGSQQSSDLELADLSDRADVIRLLSELSWERFLARASRYHLARGELLGEQKLLVPLFDALGYSTNRGPMRRTAERLLSIGPGVNPREILHRTIACSGLPEPVADRILERFSIRTPLREVVLSLETERRREEEKWSFRLRPSNRPESRLVAGAVLIDRLFRRGGLDRIRSAVEEGVGGERIREHLLVRSGDFSFVGNDRAGAIMVNILLPALLAEGVASGRFDLICGACRCYRQFPSLSSNSILRNFSSRFLNGRSVSGSFLQQGVIAYMSRNSRC